MKKYFFYNSIRVNKFMFICYPGRLRHKSKGARTLA